MKKKNQKKNIKQKENEYQKQIKINYQHKFY